MRKIYMIGICTALFFVLIVAFVTPACTNGVDITPSPTKLPISISPQAIVVQYLLAHEAMDAEAVSEFFTADQRDEMLAQGNNIYSQVDSIEISNLETALVSEVEDDATVQAIYDWQIIISGQIESGHQREIIDLVRENDYWLVKTVIILPDYIEDSEAQYEFEIDIEVMQIVVATFYSDIHGGFNSQSHAWCDASQGAGSLDHYYPTSLGFVNEHTLIENGGVRDNNGNPRIDDNSLGIVADDIDIGQHAVWMGLVVNEAGVFTPIQGGSDKRGEVSPLTGEVSLYMWETPQSASTMNDAQSLSGSYTWIVGMNGVVFGVYKGNDGYWYSGFQGIYP